MQITVNGESKRFEDGATLEDIMKSLGVVEKVMAAAVNMEVVKREKWDSFKPKEGDKIELLHFVGGG